MTSSLGHLHLQQARASVQQALNWFASARRHWNYPPEPALQAAVRPQLQSLKAALAKIEQKLFTIAVFGLVSQGKSALINALVGEKRLATGPLHGVTAWPQSLRWGQGEKLTLDLIDTPGLDEIDGQRREDMAQQVAQQADLILFVVSGDITQREWRAIRELRDYGKPMLLVFNKIDLYPDQDRQTLYQKLQALAPPGESRPLFDPDDIICVAADPQPQLTRLEYPDRPPEEQWLAPPPLIEPLREKILAILNREGLSLLALNALIQTRQAEAEIAQKTLELREEQADALIWKYAQYKALAVAVNPVPLLDVIGALTADLFLIRALARLYGLPMTSFEAGRLWRKILFGAGGVLLAEWLGGLVWGLDKTAGWLESPGNLSRYLGSAFLQAGAAGYSAYGVGQAAKVYLQQGASWGPLGASAVITGILQEMERDTLTARLLG